jgi:hypothetical protein
LSLSANKPDKTHVKPGFSMTGAAYRPGMIDAAATRPALSRHWMRFAVGDRVGHWAPTWKLWLDEHDPRCLHVGCRSLGGHYSFAWRDKGGLRHQFTHRSARCDTGVSADGVRVSCLAAAPLSNGPDLVELMRVRTEACAVCEPTLRGRYRYVARVPIHPGRATEIRVLAIGRGTAMGVWPVHGLLGTIPLGTLEPASDLRILVVYRSVRPIGLGVSAEAAGRPFHDLIPSGELSA